jgi:ABC-type transport system substrate-binding protein
MVQRGQGEAPRRFGETDVKKRRALIDRVQVIFYEDVGRVKLGDYFLLDMVRKDVRGFQSTPELYFWNAWLAR